MTPMPPASEAPNEPLALINANVPVVTESDKVAPFVLLDDNKRLSESVLWQVICQYYDSQGVDAWKEQVPFFVTNSVYIAEAYADLVIAYLHDMLPMLNREEPIYLVELATGTGRFGYYFVRELHQKRQRFAALKDLKLTYVMTDFTEKNMAFWQQHEKLKPMIEAGLLDMAIFIPETSREITLKISGKTLASGTLANPLVVFANYFFDTIRHDVFLVNRKKLMEGRVSVEGPAQDAHRHIDKLKVDYRYPHEVSPQYYSQQRFNKILKHYSQYFAEQGSIIFPIGALNSLANLEAISNHRMFLISSDKGFTNIDFMQGHFNHRFAVHGSFSFMVNYDAIARYFTQNQGLALMTTPENLAIQTGVFLEDPAGLPPMEHLSYAFEDKLDATNAPNFIWNVHWLVAQVAGQTGPQKIDSLLSYLQISRCEPTAFCHIAPMLLDVCHKATPRQLADLRTMMDSAWEKYFFFPGECKLPYWIAQVYYFLGEYEQALAFFDKTTECFGEQGLVFFFKGHCYESMGKPEEAKASYDYALVLEPELQDARDKVAAMQAGAAT